MIAVYCEVVVGCSLRGYDMAIYHINPKAKKESGVIVTGEDAKKVMEILHNPEIRKKQFLKTSQLLSSALKTINTLKEK